MGLIGNAVNETLDLMGQARLTSMALKDMDCCANCKKAKKSRDYSATTNNKCVSCGLTGKVVRYNDYCSSFQKPFLGQTGDKRKELILRDMMYRKYY